MIVIETKNIGFEKSSDGHKYITGCNKDDPFYPVSEVKGLEVSAVSKALSDIDDSLTKLIGSLHQIDECVMLELSMKKPRGESEYRPDPFSCFAVVVLIVLQQYLDKKQYDESSNIVLARYSDSGVDMKEYLLKIMPDVIEGAFDLQSYVDGIMYKYGDAND